MHPALEPYRQVLFETSPSLPHLDLHSASARIATLNRVGQARGLRNWQGVSLRFVDAVPGTKAADYELEIGGPGGQACIQTRIAGEEGLHDLMNAMAWLHFARTKTALNQLQVEQIQLQITQAGLAKRSVERDRITLLDENGAVLVTQNAELIALVRERAWAELFLDHRRRLLSEASLYVFGHGLLQKCVRPFKSMTARLWIIEQACDASLESIDAGLADSLLAKWPHWPKIPLPVSGWPGWSSQTQDAAFYEDKAVFR